MTASADSRVSAEVAVVRLTAEDWPVVRAIYAEGIARRHATFEAEPPGWEGDRR
jgi:phosphinothricin acetyltransferase